MQRLAGALRGAARLVYVDRHLDLHTPTSTTEGSFRWMGVAHCLALDGADPQLVAAAGPTPLLQPADIAYLRVQTDTLSTYEQDRVASLGLTVVAQDELVARPADAARVARSALRPGPFAVHLDVEVLDFLDAPISENVNGRNSGRRRVRRGASRPRSSSAFLVQPARHDRPLNCSTSADVPLPRGERFRAVHYIPGTFYGVA